MTAARTTKTVTYGSLPVFARNAPWNPDVQPVNGVPKITSRIVTPGATVTSDVIAIPISIYKLLQAKAASLDELEVLPRETALVTGISSCVPMLKERGYIEDGQLKEISPGSVTWIWYTHDRSEANAEAISQFIASVRDATPTVTLVSLYFRP